MLRINIFFIFCLLFTQILVAQVTNTPCIGYENGLVDLTPNATSTQSTTDGTGLSAKAIDGQNTGSWSTQQVSKTLHEPNPWWQADLGDKYVLNKIRIFYPSDIYPQGLSNYYILISNWPFENTSLSSQLASPLVQSIHVNTALQSGSEIPLSNQTGQYVRIQSAGTGVLSFIEIDIPGGGDEEICGNGLDDDCDGAIDCGDSDCAPKIITVIKTNPSCPICNDGQIRIQAAFPNNGLFYSIDGGNTFINSCNNSYLCTASNLSVGAYNIVVKSNDCIVSYNNNPVLLQAATGVSTSDCNNGDFESGTFEGWSGGIGTRDEEDGSFELQNTSLSSSSERFKIIPATGVDPQVPELSLDGSCNGGTYIARLGNSNINGEVERLTYCFTVDNSNQDFYFNFAVVLQDPDHDPEDQPFFQYSVFLDPSNPIQQEQFVAGDDPFFEEFEEKVYKGWTCRYINLSQYVGDEICIEFITADCSKGQHFGYAYIDNLCSNLEDNLPIPSFTLEQEAYCSFDEIIADGSGSLCENKYTWSVCKITNGVETEVVTETFFNNIGEINVEAFYNNNSLGYTFDCDQSYRVKLTAKNDCGESPGVYKEFYNECSAGTGSYFENIAICWDEWTTDYQTFQMQGNFVCPTCTYVWSPSSGLNNPNVAYPSFSIGGNINGKTYTVLITDTENGCTASYSVNIFNVINPTTWMSNEERYCDYIINGFFSVEGGYPLNPELFHLEWYDPTNGQSLPGTVTYSFPNNSGFFASSIEKSKNFSGVDPLGIRVQFNDNVYLYETGSGCDFRHEEEIQGDDYYFNCFSEIYVPNVFSPNGNNVNDEWIIFTVPSGYKAYWYQLQIFDRWGGLAYEIEEWADVNTPFSNEHIKWDGLQYDSNGNPITDGQGNYVNWPIGVYVYKLNFANCDNFHSYESPGYHDGDDYPYYDENCNPITDGQGNALTKCVYPLECFFKPLNGFNAYGNCDNEGNEDCTHDCPNCPQPCQGCNALPDACLPPEECIECECNRWASDVTIIN